MDFILIIVFILIVAFIMVYNNSSPKKIKALEDEYRTLLNGSDKRAALRAGRAYYAELRKGKSLTVYDEQAIANDLSTMD